MISSHRTDIRCTNAANAHAETNRELQTCELVAVSGGGIREKVHLPVYDSVATPSPRQIDQ
jgi:hypothetical protein